MPTLSYSTFMAAAVLSVVAQPLVAQRTVSSNERGLYYALPSQCNGNFNCTNWSGIGAYLGQGSYQNFWNALDDNALKLVHARFQHLAPFDDYTEALFPFAQLLAYDQAQTLAGNPSLFVSAYYQGANRPVLWNWYGSQDSLYINNPGRAMNLKDDRYVQFWVSQYARPWLNRINRPNTVIVMDNCSFSYGSYGVKDNSGNFISGVTWNQPYAQNQADFLNSINNFFVRVHQIDSGIRMGCNTDAREDPGDFSTAFQNLEGITVEDMEYLSQSGGDWWRGAFYTQFQNLTWVGNAGKWGVFEWQFGSNDANSIRRAYMHYLMVRSNNSFFAPQNGSNEVPPTYYSAMQTALGTPVAATNVAQEPGRPTGYALYSRRTSGGMAFLNWSGTTKTVTLPSGQAWVDVNNQPVTQLTINDMDGTYARSVGTSANGSPGTHFLSDLQWISATNSWGPVERDQSNGEAGANDGRQQSIRGAKFAKGLGVHAYSNVQFDLRGLGSCSAFNATVGIDDETNGAGAADFQVWGDGNLLFDAGAQTGTTPGQQINLGIGGVRTLGLIVNQSGNLYYAHGDWANASVSCQ